MNENLWKEISEKEFLELIDKKIECISGSKDIGVVEVEYEVCFNPFRAKICGKVLGVKLGCINISGEGECSEVSVRVFGRKYVLEACIYPSERKIKICAGREGHEECTDIRYFAKSP